MASQLVCGLVNAGQLGHGASDFPGLADDWDSPGSEVTEVGLCCLTGRQRGLCTQRGAAEECADRSLLI